MNLSFAGCGFLAVYHLGALNSLARHSPTFWRSIKRCAGASGGSLAAAVATLGPDKIQECIRFTYDVTREIRALPLGALAPGFNVMHKLEEYLQEILPENAHELATDRLFISVTEIDSKENMVVSKYKSREEVLQWLLCSCYIPLYGGIKAPQIDGKGYMDGGFTNNLPSEFAEGRTIYISPFCGRQHISPADQRGRGWFLNIKNQHFQLNIKNTVRFIHALFPPTVEELEMYYQRGGLDALKFLKSQSLHEK